MNKTAQLEEYEGHTIEAKQVPEGQFVSRAGFGWAFRIHPLTNSATLLCTVVLKSLSGERTQANLHQALKMGQNVVHLLIDEEKFEKDYYCYQWEPTESEPLEVDCNKISPEYF